MKSIMHEKDGTCCKNYKKCMEDDYSPDESMCKECLKDWLQQEAQ